MVDHGLISIRHLALWDRNVCPRGAVLYLMVKVPLLVVRWYHSLIKIWTHLLRHFSLLDLDSPILDNNLVSCTRTSAGTRASHTHSAATREIFGFLK